MNNRMTLFGLAGLCAAATIPAALAQQPAAPGSENGRYAMTPAPNGFLRMDTRTGAVSLCTLREGTVSCTSSADDRGALETENARLTKENAELRDRLSQLTQQGGSAGPSAQSNRGGLPSADEMDKALGFAETFMRRMMRIMREETPKGERL